MGEVSLYNTTWQRPRQYMIAGMSRRAHSHAARHAGGGGVPHMVQPSFFDA